MLSQLLCVSHGAKDLALHPGLHVCWANNSMVELIPFSCLYSVDFWVQGQLYTDVFL